MRIASFDIGTNTILLLIADVDSTGIRKILHDEQVIARLGKGVDEHKIISQETFQRAENFLTAYKQTCSNFSVDKIIAVGTSALRDAKNQKEFCVYIKHKVGIDIEVLSGDEEAQWTYRGGISEFLDRAERFSVFDIGGGSTEIITGNHTQILSKTSINIGSVRITERILKEAPPTDAAIAEAHEFILSNIPKVFVKDISSTFAIGVAGTLTTLAALDQQLPFYSSEKIDGYRLSQEVIGSLFAKLKDKSIDQIKAFPQISAGREDIILAGTMILLGCMEASKITSITVSDRGLRYGIVHREIEKLLIRTSHQQSSP
ncbi:MAG: Ppx/GppA phosphatase family protein [Bacteroidota bacterium]|nr:Ppx/GppA phosphatase family protein [Bacteroidota bacterium]